mgnify:CR=1 FL=1|tara:strand:- start:30 stop:761 length:732 start_codon:yes stop_codon:yes gene_type:complete
MKKFTYIIFALLTIVTLNSCEDKVEALDTNYIAFGDDLYSTGVDVGGSTSVVIPVYTANLSGADRTFSLSVDPTSNAATSSYTLPASVTIPANTNSNSFTVALSDTDLGIGVNKLIINFENEIGLSTGAATTVSYIQNCTEVTATLEINFDAWASESSWTITDSLGGVVASKAVKSYTDGQASAVETITLCAGRNYTFTYNDSFGDGLSDPTDGNVTLTINNVEKGAVTGNFGTKYEVAFDTK